MDQQELNSGILKREQLPRPLDTRTLFYSFGKYGTTSKHQRIIFFVNN